MSQATRRIGGAPSAHSQLGNRAPQVYGPPLHQSGLRQQAMQQLGQWQTQQSWQAQHQQVHQIAHNPKNFEAPRHEAAPATQANRRAQSQAIPIVDAPSSSSEKPLIEFKSSALMIVDPDTMQEVKVEKMAPKPRTGGKGKGPRLTGLANYEARKMQRQSSIGNTQVSSAVPRPAPKSPLTPEPSPEPSLASLYLQEPAPEYREPAPDFPAQWQPSYNGSEAYTYAEPEWEPAPEEASPELEEEDKGRSKAQLKNQKKHQRQRDRKAKELRAQCLQLVVKWKLNALALPLFSMGFPQQLCIDAVCACSDGKSAVDLERCVAWIVNEQSKGSAFGFGSTEDNKGDPQPDIDITDELKRMGQLEDMGISGPEVERAVLAHNGDVNSAAATLGDGAAFTAVH